MANNSAPETPATPSDASGDAPAEEGPRKWSLKDTIFGKKARPKVPSGVDVLNPKGKKSITARDGRGVV